MKKVKNLIIFILLIIILTISSIFLYNETLSTPCYSTEDGKQLPILMYHHVTTKSSLLNKYTISVEQFENDLIYIRDNGFETITMSQLLNHVYENAPLPEKPIMITFDDGYESFYAYVYPLLKKYNMSAIISIVGSFTDVYTKDPDHNLDYSYLNWQQINEMANSGYVEVQNHTYDLHKIENGRKGCNKKTSESIENYTNILEADVLKLQQQILMYTGHKATTFTYPFGSYSKLTKELIKNMGFFSILTCAETLNTITYDTEWLYSLGRFNRSSGISTDKFFAKVLKNYNS